MSQWSEKIPKENLSKTVSSTGYLFTSFSEVWIQINNFRKSCRKFIIDLLTKNVALNLSGAIFFVGLGYSLKWWYKDQLFVVLLKQNLPALSESQKNISWDLEKTGESILNNEYQTWTPFIDRIDLYGNHICVKFKQPWQKHVSERFIGVFGEPAQANVSKQVLTIPFTREKDWWRENTEVVNNYLSSDAYKQSVSGVKLLKKNSKASAISKETESKKTEQVNNFAGSLYSSKRVLNDVVLNPLQVAQLTPCSAKGLRLGDLSEDLSGYPLPAYPEGLAELSSVQVQIYDLSEDLSEDWSGVNSAKFSTYTLLNPERVGSATQEKLIFPKKWFKLSPRNLYSDAALNQEVILPSLGSGTSKQRSPFSKFSKMWTPRAMTFRWHNSFTQLLRSSFGIPLRRNPRTVARVNTPGWGSWRSEATKLMDKSTTLRYPNPLQIEDLDGASFVNASTDKLSYPLQLTKRLAGWQPFPNLLVLNSYLDEIPYKLENALQSYLPKKNSQLLFLSTSFRKSLNSRIPHTNLRFVRGAAMNNVIIKSNSVNTLLCKAFVSNPSILQSKSFTRYLPGLLQQNVGSTALEFCNNWQNKDGLAQLGGQEQKNQKLAEDFISLSQLLCHKSDSFSNKYLLKEKFTNPEGGMRQSNCDNEIQQHEKLVIEELEAEGTDVKGSKRWRGLLFKLKNSWVSDFSANYKSRKTENNETEKTLDLFKETFLVPAKQSETYLKKLHLFETKKLLQKQFAVLINSFPIDLVEKSGAILEEDKHSRTGDELAQCQKNKRSGVVLTNCLNEVLNPEGVSIGAKQKRGKANVVNKTAVENNKYVPDSVRVKDSNVFATSVVSDNKNNLFETNDGLITNNKFNEAYIKGAPDYHHLVDVTKKVLAITELTPDQSSIERALASHGGLRRNTQKGVILPPAFQTQNVRDKNNYSKSEWNPPVLTPSGLVELVKQRKSITPMESTAKGFLGEKIVNKSVAEEYWGTEVDRLTQLFAYSNIANAADAEGLDPLLLLNTLGFTFNNFSPLTNPPILLSYDKLGVVSNRVINISKPARENNSATLAELTPDQSLIEPTRGGLRNVGCDAALPKKSENFISLTQTLRNSSSSKHKLLQQHKDFLEEKIVNDGSVTPWVTPEGYASDLLYKLLCVAKEPQKGIFDSYKSISFYFNPKNLNWIVFQHSTNDKFNLFLKKINVTYPFAKHGVTGELNKESNAYPSNATQGERRVWASTGLIPSNQPITTQLTNLMFEFLKGKKGLSYVYPFGLEKDNYVDNKGGNNFTHYLPQTSWQSKENVIEEHLVQQHQDFLEEEIVEESKVASPCEANISFPDQSSDKSSSLNPFAEHGVSCVTGKGLRKLRDLIKINTIINKVDRFTISSNVTKINFKQKETKIETPTPGYKINVVDKDINLDKNSRYMSGYVYPDIQSKSLKAFLYQWLSSCNSCTPKGYALEGYRRYASNKTLMPWFSSHYLSDKPIADPFRGKTLLYSKDLQSCSNPSTRQALKGLLQRSVGDERYAKCEHNVYPYGISLSLVGSKEKTGNTDITSSVARTLYTSSNAALIKAGRFVRRAATDPERASVAQYPMATFVRRCLPHALQRGCTSDQFLGNNHYLVNLEVPYKKFNHYLANFPGFSDQNQFFITLPQISCGNENLGKKSQERSILGELQTQYLPLQGFADPFRDKHSSWQNKDELLLQRSQQLTSQQNDSINIIDKSEINKKFIQKNGCDSRKVAYSGIVVRRNKWTKDFQPFKDEDNKYKKELFKEHPHTQAKIEAGANKSSIWGTLFLGPKNPLTDRQCHFFGQKQLSTLDTNSLQRDYLRQLGKEILTQSNSKGYTELSKFSSIERTKILSLSKKVNSFFFKRRKYSYLLEPKDQWHLLFQEQLCTALEDCKKYPFSTIQSVEETNIEKLNLDSGRIKVSAPLIMVRFPKKLVQSRNCTSESTHFVNTIRLHNSLLRTPCKGKGVPSEFIPMLRKGVTELLAVPQRGTAGDTNHRFVTREGGMYASVSDKLTSYQPNTLLQGISWRPLCHLADPLQRIPHTNLRFNMCVEGTTSMCGSYAPLKNLYPAIAKENPYYPLFTERFSDEINAVPCLNKNSLFYSTTDSLTISSPRKSLVTDSVEVKVAVPRRGMHWKNMKSNFLGIQNMCTSQLIQEPPTLSYSNFWAVLNQWVFLIALLFWVEQTLLNNVFPALFALEQILLSAAGLRTGENNRTQVLRISKNETPKFQNLAGIDGLLGELSELVLFLRGQQNLGERFWNKWNKKNSYGVLLTGSPGTGKTFLVRALANEAKVPVLILSASTLTASKLNNNKPSWSIRHAFKRAKQLAPCILFIDEIDALGKSRGKIVTDINEIVADTNSLTPSGSASASASFLTHKLTQSTHHNSANPLAQQMFSYEQFGQNCSNFNATLFNKWEYPLQSTILQESNEINQNSLCQEKLVDLLNIVGGFSQRGSTLALTGGNGAFTSLGSEASKPLTEFKKESTNETTYSRSDKGTQQSPRLEKEMTRGKFGPLTQLLVSMDGVSSFSGVLIMGATNRPELLDPALTRPGRFEKIIRIDKPSEQNRIEILQLYSQNLGVQQQIPWSYLATRTIGLTTADLAVAMNYSSLRAIIQDSVHTLETIEYGLNCITRY